MSFLRGSQNYVWSTTSVLGKGATGAVYQGVNKTNGEPVAVKTFNQHSHLRPREVKLREFEVLQKVNHQNIVKLLAIEEEQENKVIVMELCTGGSLYNILDDPENTYGLEEKEFLSVLGDLTAGMKHLRDNNLVHRDLKPGNIMKFICEDGTTIYKLTDFGAARELQEGQQFQSLYGTEEYLHPDMYERAVLRKYVNKTFGATIDLWSIGVTLYHVATGNLPFRPFGGRKNKETMYYITTKKESGVISGIQTKENGPIEWKRELPENCQLSDGLKKTITPLLAGLLEADAEKIWTFDRFFTEVTNTLSRKAIDIFHVNMARSIKVYLHPDEVYTHLQEYIQEQTQISLNSQLLIYKSALITNFVDDTTRGCGYPNTTDFEPIFLFSKENNNVTIAEEAELPTFKEFPQVIHVENDAAQSKLACSIGHVCKRRIEKYSQASKLIWDSVENLTEYVNSELKQINSDSQHLLEKTMLNKESAQIFRLSQQIAGKLMTTFKPVNYCDKLKTISDSFISESAAKVQQLHQKYAVENTLKLEWDSSTRLLKCPARTRAPARARTQVEHLRDSWQHLVRDRATRTLSYNDEQFHILERIKITQTINRIKDLLEKEVFPQYSQLADNLGDWYKMSQTVYLQSMILGKDVRIFEEELKNFEEELAIENVQYTEHVKNYFEQVKNVVPLKAKKTQNQKLRLLLKECAPMKSEINDVLDENNILINQMNDLLKKVLTNDSDD